MLLITILKSTSSTFSFQKIMVLKRKQDTEMMERYRCGETSEESLEDHDFNLQNVLEQCGEKAIKLNGAKVQLGVKTWDTH